MRRNNLIVARNEKKLSQKKVAELIGISERAYKFIEYGERIGSIEVWDKLEDLFGIHQRVLREVDVQPKNQ